MPRKSSGVLLEHRVTFLNMNIKSRVLAPLPVEESDVESPVEDVPPTTIEVAKINDEPVDATMEDGGHVEGDDDDDDNDDDDDPETSV